MTTTPPQQRPVFVLTVDGVQYRLDTGAVNATIARRVRHEAGVSWRQWVETLNADSFDIDTVAVVMFAAQLQAGVAVTLADIERRVSYASEMTVDIEGGDTGGEIDPEAPGGP